MTTPQPTSRTSRAVSLVSSAATMHRTAGREDPVQAARHDVAGEALREPDDVDVRARERERQALALLVREEAHGLLDLEPLRERDHLGVARAEAGDHDPQVVAVAQERRRADEAVEILRVADVARVHDDEPPDEVVLLAPTRCRAAAA